MFDIGIGATLDEDALGAWDRSAAGCMVAVAMHRRLEADIGARRARRMACMASDDGDGDDDEKANVNDERTKGSRLQG